MPYQSVEELSTLRTKRHRTSNGLDGEVIDVLYPSQSCRRAYLRRCGLDGTELQLAGRSPSPAPPRRKCKRLFFPTGKNETESPKKVSTGRPRVWPDWLAVSPCFSEKGGLEDFAMFIFQSSLISADFSGLLNDAASAAPAASGQFFCANPQRSIPGQVRDFESYAYSSVETVQKTGRHENCGR